MKPEFIVDLLSQKVIEHRQKNGGQTPTHVLLTPAEADDLLKNTGADVRKPWVLMFRLGEDVGYKASLPIAKIFGGHAKVGVCVDKNLLVEHAMLSQRNLYETVVRLATEIAAAPSLKKLCEVARDCGGGHEEYDDVATVIDALEQLARRLAK
jgi:hypothetical protein